MWRIRYALEQSNRLRALPALARDLGACVVVLAAFAAAAALPLITVPAAALVLLPVLLLTAVAFGRDSALLAALLAALVARLSPSGPAVEGSFGLLAIAVLFGGALAVAALLEELRRRWAEAENAHLRSDATARRAAERVEAARRQLREAEKRLAEAERKARQAGQGLRAAARTSSPDPDMEGAFRSEGGV
jgi:hypothetical protein